MIKFSINYLKSNNIFRIKLNFYLKYISYFIIFLFSKNKAIILS
jgi:hypothetical protein